MKTLVKWGLLASLIIDARLYSQDVQYAESFQLNTSLSSNSVYMANSQINLKTGFSFKATNDNSFFAMIGYQYKLNPSDNNYIYSVKPRVAIKSIPDYSSYRMLGYFNEQIDYYDGLGRPLQNVSVCSSPTKADVIVPHAYDNIGREANKYLPYTLKIAGETGAFDVSALSGTLSTFYSSGSTSDVTKTNYPFSESMFENSPLNRVIEQSFPGATWKIGSGTNGNYSYKGYLDFATRKAAGEFTGNYSGHTCQTLYESNTTNEVYLYTIEGNTLKASGRYYDAGELYKTTSRNENWVSSGNANLNSVCEYKDKKGNVILKRTFDDSGNSLSTYYVYDDFNLLRYVLSPNSSDGMAPVSETNYTSGDDIVKNLCYYYEYDEKKRMTKKQLPGADPVYMVYDPRDRLVAIQDGNLRDPNKDGNGSGKTSDAKWSFIKYDELNRPVATGTLVNGLISQTAMQGIVTDGYTIAPADYATYGEKLDAGSLISGYTENTFPKTVDGTINYLTMNYYDDYSFSGKIGCDITYKVDDYVDDDGNNNGYNDFVGGQVTTTKVRILNYETTQQHWMVSTTYYDDKYRPIQVRRQYTSTEASANLLFGTGFSEIIATKYSFDGQVLVTKDKQIMNGTTTTEVTKSFEYDHAGRLANIYNQITGDANGKVLIASMNYNEVGQLKCKKLHTSAGGTSIQQIDYKYNPRGWVTSINEPNLLGTDAFGMTLFYETPPGYVTATSQYNGNISGLTWSNKNTNNVDGVVKAYGFTYDVLNRFKAADYGEAYYFGINADAYNEGVENYDKNGNIIKLNRNLGLYTVDILTYNYLTNSNKLAKVTDNAVERYKSSGFVDGNTTGDDFSYDVNGNLTKDLNRGISSISYNLLNLPNVVTKDANNKVTYIYSATGEKLVTKVNSNSATATSRYYLGSFEYSNDKSLSLIKMEEGIINNTGTAYVYEYHLKDHLGNVRATVIPGSTAGSFTVNQVNEYYPFGMLFSTPSSTANQYFYNGKESQWNLTGLVDWYDYGARFYDPQIGRWHAVDPMCESYYNHTPYNYVLNNPINLFDPNGMWPAWEHDRIIGFAFGDMSIGEQKILSDASKFTDKFQASNLSFLHAMSDGKNTEAMIANYNEFIDNAPSIFANTADYDEALAYLGMAFHAIMDNSCKQHNGFQVWDGMADKSASAKHIVTEVFSRANRNDPLVKRAVSDMQRLYERAMKLRKEKGQALKGDGEGSITYLEEVMVISKKQKSYNERMQDMMWSSVRPNANGNTGRYNKPGRSSDQNYSDEFLKWYYGDSNKK